VEAVRVRKERSVLRRIQLTFAVACGDAERGCTAPGTVVALIRQQSSCELFEPHGGPSRCCGQEEEGGLQAVSGSPSRKRGR
jgi:hypothetical protein